MVVSVRTTLSLGKSWAKDPIPPYVSYLQTDPPARSSLLTRGTLQVMRGIHRSTRQEYAIKVLDKGHLKRNNKLNTALAEKNTLVRLGSGHPGIVRLHWAFQDEWSLCESPPFLLPSRFCQRWVRRLPPVTAEEGQGHLCWQRVTRLCVDGAVAQSSLASPREATLPYMCPRSCYGRRSDYHDFLPAKTSTPPSTMVHPSAFLDTLRTS
jgi:hypothetical protein